MTALLLLIVFIGGVLFLYGHTIGFLISIFATIILYNKLKIKME